MYKDGPVERARLSVGGVSLNVDVSRPEAGINIAMPPRQNPPSAVEKSTKLFEEAIRKASTFTLTKTSKFKAHAADAAYLKTAYLGAFAKFRYRWILSEHLNSVRNQIQEPLEEHIQTYRVHLKANEFPWKLGLFLLESPTQCLLAKIDTTAVLLPWVKGIGADVFEWLAERKRQDKPFSCKLREGGSGLFLWSCRLIRFRHVSPNNGVESARSAPRTATPLRGFTAAHAGRWPAEARE